MEGCILPCITEIYTFNVLLPCLCYSVGDTGLTTTGDLTTTGRWFDPRFDQYSFRGLKIVIGIRFMPLTPLSIASTMAMQESSQRLGKNIERNTGKGNFRKAWIGAPAAAI